MLVRQPEASVSPFSTYILLRATYRQGTQGLPGRPVVKNSSCNAGDVGSLSGQASKITTRCKATNPHHHNYRVLVTQILHATKTQCSQIFFKKRGGDSLVFPEISPFLCRAKGPAK